MAVRFDAIGDPYTSTAPPTTNVWSVTTWAMVVTDRNAASILLTVEDSGENLGLYIGTNTDGTTLTVFDQTTNHTSNAMTVGTWYRIGIVVNGASLTVYFGAAGAALGSSSSGTAAPAATPVSLIIGGSPTAADWFNGRLAAFKLWSGVALTAAEIENELAQYAPARTDSLHRWHPWLVAETTDYSGNARTLTAGGTATSTEDGPPIPWEVAPAQLMLADTTGRQSGAVRFDADGEDYTVTSAIPATLYTITMWGRLAVDRNDFTTFLSIDNDDVVASYTLLATGSDGTTLALFRDNPAGSTVNTTSLTVGTWYRFGIVRNGANVTVYYGALGSALSSASQSDWTGTETPVIMRIGESLFPPEWLNGNVANFKQYAAALTQAEVEAELSQYAPVRTDSLARWHPFITADATDYSGNARTLSGGTGATTEDGPPISWMAHETGLILPGGASTTVSAENAAATGAANNAAPGVAPFGGNPAGTGVANDSVVTVTDAPRPLYRSFAVPRAANF